MTHSVSLSTSKRSSSAIASLSGNEKGSENYSNYSNLSGLSEKNYAMKKRKIEKVQNLQNKILLEFEKLINIVLDNIHLKYMLDAEKLRKVHNFQKISPDQKYLLLRFYSLSNRWYNIYKFCSKVHFDADDKKIFDIFKKFHNEGLVEFVDYQNDKCDLRNLLEPLSTDQLKKISTELFFNEKPNKRTIKSNLKTQIAEKYSSTNDLKVFAMQAIEKVLGRAARLSQSLYDTFNYIYILSTFTNPKLSDISNYFKHVINENGVFLEVQIQTYPVFSTRDDFTKYVAAVQMQKQLDCERNIIEINILADKAYQKLLADQRQGAENIFPHIQQFASNQVYCSILSKCCELLFKNNNCENDNLRMWLNFLSQKFSNSRQLGTWLYQIVKILEKKENIEEVADILIKNLSERINVVLKEKDLFELGKIGRLTIKKLRKLGIVSKCDRLIELIPRNIDISLFKRCYINLSKRRNESERRNESKIQEATLLHYSNQGYQSVKNMGHVLKALLVLYFWDIIYYPKVVVPATFISQLQFAPIDMYIFDSLNCCSRFYGERKKFIDQRIEEIKINWSEERLVEFGKKNYQLHSQRFSAAGVIMNIIDNVNTIEVLVSVIGREILAKIFERLITDLDQYDEGMPEFLFWNTDGISPKFVVNSTSDSLTELPIATSLWLEYLALNKAQVEVCVVHAADIKNKMKIQSSSATKHNST
ncbi:fanconi-associated nuclease 1-like [Euwallacea fornicatus]|uniref:fanconi-associated nuclease 1-like n=1 Tax=Euwallacea fornicatus TaxID=995702 RepID=UPI00338FD430